MPEIVKENPVNNPTIKGVNSRSHFPKLGYKLEHTPLFGEYTPSAAMEVVPDDKKVRFQLKHNARSYTLKAPLMSDVMMKKDAFIVYNKCILPLNWHLFTKPPKLGDDVPQDANCLFDVTSSVLNFVGSWEMDYDFADISAGIPDVSEADALIYLNGLFRFYIFHEYFFSNGSLFANLGCQLSKYWRVTNVDLQEVYSFDKMFDSFMFEFVKLFASVTVQCRDGYYKCVADTTSKIGVQSYRWLVEQWRDDNVLSITSYVLNTGYTDQNDVVDVLKEVNPWDYNTDFNITSFFGPDVDRHLIININRELSYQITCAHFYTNDNVDYIYSADLYRQYVMNIMLNVINAGAFSWNGISVIYDVLCKYHFDEFIGSASYSQIFTLVRALFGFNRSLRYKDYFVGSRTRPIAVGDTTAPVVSNEVNVIELAQATAMTRLLNAVNRLKSGIDDYLRGIFNSNPKPDYHDPQWLCSLTDTVFTPETENTAEAQQTNPNSVTALFRSSGDNYAFETDVEEFATIIVITSFDVERCYKDIIDRQYFHFDRYDMFNPFLQYVGDIPIYRDEFTIGGSTLEDNPIGYNLKDIEYKERPNIAVGGFVENLPGYAFMDDEQTRGYSPDEIHVSPDFIRSRPCELDKFYISLTGWSRGSYFHFIIKNTNKISASRPMVYAPSIM